MRHPWKQFSLMISESTGAVSAVESMCPSWEQFRWWFLSWQWLSFHWCFLSPQGLFALSNPCLTRGSSFVEDFWGHGGLLRCRIHASSVEAVSLRISKSTVTQFSLIISESTGVVCAVESMCHPWKQFRLWFLSQQGLFALSNRASPVEAVLLMISTTATTQFSLMISELTGAVCAVESMCHPWKQFRWWFLSP